jgi:hypothetical protein
LSRFLCYILVLCCIATNAQENLVPNGSFEIITQCPDYQSENLIGGSRLEYATGWFYPTSGSSDLFNSCNDTISQCCAGHVGVPENVFGFQYPFHGQGYAGFGVWENNSPPESYTEYVSVELNRGMIAGEEFKVRFYLSLSNESTHGVTGIGVWFSVSSPATSQTTLISKKPQIVNAAIVYSDTSFWQLFEGYYSATGCENFMTIGYFKEGLDDTFFVQSPDSTQLGLTLCYYYIDSVSVDLIGYSEGSKGINVFSPNDDGVNDTFSPSVAGTMYVYNRWGQVVWIGDGAWDGKNKEGKDCLGGVYFYTINSDCTTNTQGYGIRGTVHLFR